MVIQLLNFQFLAIPLSLISLFSMKNDSPQCWCLNLALRSSFLWRVLQDPHQVIKGSRHIKKWSESVILLCWVNDFNEIIDCILLVILFIWYNFLVIDSMSIRWFMSFSNWRYDLTSERSLSYILGSITTTSVLHTLFLQNLKSKQALNNLNWNR